MEYLIRAFIVFSLVAFTSACSTTFKVVSEPSEAEVYIVPKDPKAEKKVIGKTPLEMPVADLQKSIDVAPGEFFSLVVAKQGFDEQTFSLPATRFGTSVTELNVQLKNGEMKKEVRSAKEILEQIFLAQRFALSNQYERALIEIDKILVKYPDFARALSMKGSIYFAQKNYQESLKWYEEAIKADPQLEETVKMAARVRQAIGGRLPASTPAPTGTK